MKSEVIAGRYADALLAAATEHKTAEAVLEQIQWYQKTAAASTSPLLENPMIPSEKKEALITRLFTGGDAGSPASAGAKILFHFICLLLRKGRVGYLGDIFRLYPIRYEAAMGIIKGTLSLAYPISDDLMGRLKGKIEARMRRRVTLEIKQDPQILGGFVFATGTELIDASVKRLLVDLEERLKTIPVA